MSTHVKAKKPTEPQRTIELDQLDENDQRDAHEDLMHVRGMLDELQGHVTLMKATRGGPNSRMVNRLDVIQAEASKCVPLLGRILANCNRLRWTTGATLTPKPAKPKGRRKVA